MKLEDAIEILTDEQKDHHSFPTDIIGKAELYGIEALKRVILYRKGMYTGLGDKFPGETED